MPISTEVRSVLVTGAAGFIGSFLAARLLDEGVAVVGLDNMNHYYDPKLKFARLARLQAHKGFRFYQGDLADTEFVDKTFNDARPNIVVNLGAQAGVRYSLENPRAYIDSNVVGFLNILENCRRTKIDHLVYASTSSVYGANPKMPFSTEDNVDHPVSLYAATKKSNELMAHSYAHLYGISTTGLRFFTVYGPWGRPDMAYFIFTKKILAGETIDVFNNGESSRDFTYVDDIVEGIRRVMNLIPSGDVAWAANGASASRSTAPYRLYNIGNNRPEKLMDMIGFIESALGSQAKTRFLPLQPGDVVSTWADIEDLSRDTGFAPSTPLNVGLNRFVDWYRDFYR